MKKQIRGELGLPLEKMENLLFSLTGTLEPIARQDRPPLRLVE